MQYKHLKSTIYLLSLFFQMAQISAQAQIGLSVGSNSSLVYFDSNFNFPLERQASVGLGLLARVPLNHSLYLQPEIAYINRGYKIPIDVTDINGTFFSTSMDFDFDYLDIGTTVIAHFGSRRVRLFFGGGPYISYLISGKSVLKGVGFFPDNEVKADYSLFNRFDINLTGLLGLEYWFGKLGLVLEGRYQQGITDFSNADVFDPSSGFDSITQHTSYGFRLGLLVQLGKKNG